MKHLYFLSLFTLALCFATTVNAQEKAAPQSDKQVIIIKKIVNSDGTVITEKITTTGEEGEEVTVTVNSDGEHMIENIKGDADGNVFFISSGDGEMKTIEVEVAGDLEAPHVWVAHGDGEDVVVKNIEVNVEEDEGSKVITIVSDGEKEVIELSPGAELTKEKKFELAAKGVHIMEHGAFISESDGEDVFFSNDNPSLAKRIHVITDKLTEFDFDFDFDFDMDHNMHFARVAGGGTNCVALGVFVDSDRNGGVNIQSIIDGSGAQDAGLEAGDVIHSIGEDPVENFRALHVALSNYEPGEVVTVAYEREGVTKTVEAELRAWGDLPNYKDSWRAKVKCGEERVIESPKVTKRIIIIKKGGDTPPPIEDAVVEDTPASLYSPSDYALNLENFTTFPNPTDGRFHVQFEADAKPITVSVFDATGKEIYRDNVKNFDGYYNEEIDLRGMSTGALILSVAQDGKMHSEQIILQ